VFVFLSLLYVNCLPFFVCVYTHSFSLSRSQVTLRTAAGKVWEDTSLSEWPEGFRLFAGDLGPEVKDDTLAQAFRHYQSFQMARVIRDTRTTRVRGYGFVSFGEALDCVRAIRDEQGKYCGTRPLNLMRSKHQQRSIRVSKAEAKKLLKKKQRAQFE
jgi:RNA recognition motif-containing protein